MFVIQKSCHHLTVHHSLLCLAVLGTVTLQFFHLAWTHFVSHTEQAQQCQWQMNTKVYLQPCSVSPNHRACSGVNMSEVNSQPFPWSYTYEFKKSLPVILTPCAWRKEDCLNISCLRMAKIGILIHSMSSSTSNNCLSSYAPKSTQLLHLVDLHNIHVHQRYYQISFYGPCIAVSMFFFISPDQCC
jgi:hypothetical protein